MRRLQLLDSKHSAHFWAQTASGSAAVAPQRAGPAAPGSAPQTHQVLVLAVSDGPSCCCCFVAPKTNWLPPPPTYTPPDPPSLLLPFSSSSPPAPPHVLNLLLLPPVPSPSASSMSLMVLVLILVVWTAGSSGGADSGTRRVQVPLCGQTEALPLAQLVQTGGSGPTGVSSPDWPRGHVVCVDGLWRSRILRTDYNIVNHIVK